MFGFGKNKKQDDLDILDAYDRIVENESNSDFIILDVRTSEEFEESRIENAINIDYYSNNFKDEISKLKKSRKYLVYCRSGRRSASAVKIMEDMGFNDVKNMKGGITKWINKGLPIRS
ncbi:MAG: rhodanese-like domain-containing protein [Methanobacterium sp.]|nr:rhodanese-like domain-containing protein [Methanobacterium sp.]